MVNLIRFFGWTGVFLAAISILSGNTSLFLVSQVVASISAFLWTRYLQKSTTIDLVLSLTLSVIAAVTKNPQFMYAAMLTRSVSYQFTFERVVKDRKQF